MCVYSLLINTTGNWCGETQQMPGNIPSPSRGLRRRLAWDFTILDVPEANTTKLCSRCVRHGRRGVMESCLRRRSARPPDHKMEEVRGLRRCNNAVCRVYFSRDYNSDINMLIQGRHYIEHGIWHPAYARQAPVPAPPIGPAPAVVT